MHFLATYKVAKTFYRQLSIRGRHSLENQKIDPNQSLVINLSRNSTLSSLLPPQKKLPMNISGILVASTPEHYAEVTRELSELNGIEVHIAHAETCRIIITQEAKKIGDEIASLRRIKEIPGVTMAEMVYHYVGEDEDQTPIPRSAAEMQALTGIMTNAVPEFLNQAP